jgi:hypothetical protein
MKHAITFSAIAILLAVAMPGWSQSEGTKPVPQFQGIWETDWGKMALWQAEDLVWGVYGTKGEIGGRVNSDGKLEFTWDDSPDGRGSGWMALGEDLSRFDGQWLTDIEIGKNGAIHGELLGPNNFDIADRAALEWEPGEAQVSPPAAETPEETEPVPPEEPSAPPSEESGQTGESAAISDYAAAWTGHWDTSRGELALTVDGVDVTGTFGVNGEVAGTIETTTFKGTWTVTADDGTVTQGEVLFWLSEDGLTFRGTYDVSDQPDVWLVWSGTEIEAE